METATYAKISREDVTNVKGIIETRFEMDWPEWTAFIDAGVPDAFERAIGVSMDVEWDYVEIEDSMISNGYIMLFCSDRIASGGLVEIEVLVSPKGKITSVKFGEDV